KNNDIPGARALYQKALNEGVNDPIVWVGMGHIETLEGKKDAARQRFEAAITASTKKKKADPEILNAIGRANADGDTKTGDPVYAIEKLKTAAELAPNNPDIFINMGINYLKMSDRGGDAYEAFTNAIKADPKNARARYRLGRIFLSQGNSERFLSYFNDAVASDPAFAPGYLELYSYYANRDVNKAKEYLDKFVENTDKDCNNDFFYADYLFRAGKYQESLDKAKAMEAGACATYPRLKVLKAYDYNRLGDSAQARSNIETFLSTANPKDIQSDDYELGYQVMKSFPGSEKTAISYLEKALELDTVRATRFKYMDTIASVYRKLGNWEERLKWLRLSFATNPNPSNLDIYNLGDAAANAGQYTLADSMFTAYQTKYPDQVYGIQGLARTAVLRDKDTTAGTAVPAVMNYINWMVSKDKERYKNQIITQYGYLVYVHANVQKDYAAALKDLEGILAVDPTNSYALQTSEVIKKVMNRGTAPKAAPKTTPKAPAGKTTTTTKPNTTTKK
ncbi:MAG: hypothetical protein JWQ96_998, partial [Segetibacter sp.]|nr:hypothetical protein [Segetibacter sp.]